MKILIINTQKFWRGGERQTYLLLKGLIESGIWVELLCLKECPLAKRAKSLGCHIHEVSSQITGITFLLKHGSDYDILHAMTAKSLTLAILTKHLHKRSVVYTRSIHVVPRGVLTRMKYRMTDRVVAISVYVKEIIKRIVSKDITIIPDAIEEEVLDKRRAYNLKNNIDDTGKNIIITTSALIRHKDPLTMVRVVKELSKTRDDFILLHFGDGDLKEGIQTEIRNNGIDKYYKLMGHYENVEDFFSVADAFLMTSDDEGFGSSVLDAFIYKVPVVSTDAGGLKESVQDNGFLCCVRDYKCLSSSIDRILSDNQLKKDMVEKAYKYCTKFHSVKEMANRYLSVYNGVVTDNSIRTI